MVKDKPFLASKKMKACLFASADLTLILLVVLFRTTDPEVIQMALLVFGPGLSVVWVTAIGTQGGQEIAQAWRAFAPMLGKSSAKDLSPDDTKAG